VGALIGWIVTLLFGAFGAVYLGGRLEREVVSPIVDDVNKLVAPILNPGLIVLALVGVFLVTRARR
jgi:hypothetical protein